MSPTKDSKNGVTIIIPHKNDVERLTRLLSIIDKLEVHQCIIIDDRSNAYNNPFTLSNDFPDYLFMKNKYARGAGGARNTGLDFATGEWVLFVDSDDLLLIDEFLTIQINTLGSFDLAYFSPISHYDGTNVPSHRHERYTSLIRNYIDNKDDCSEIELRYKFVSPTSKFIRRKLLNDYQIRFEESLFANDQVFSIKVGHYAKNITALNISFYSISFRSASLTRDNSLNSLIVRFNEFIKGLQFLQQNLNQQKLKTFDFSYASKSYLVKSLLYGKSIKTFLFFLKTLKENKVRIFRLRDLNIFSEKNHLSTGIRKMIINHRNRET